MRKKDKVPKDIETVPFPVRAILAQGIDDQEFKAYVALYAMWYRSKGEYITNLTATELGVILGVHKSVAGAIANRLDSKGMIYLDRIKDQQGKATMRVRVKIPTN